MKPLPLSLKIEEREVSKVVNTSYFYLSPSENFDFITAIKSCAERRRARVKNSLMRNFGLDARNRSRNQKKSAPDERCN